MNKSYISCELVLKKRYISAVICNDYIKISKIKMHLCIKNKFITIFIIDFRENITTYLCFKSRF